MHKSKDNMADKKLIDDTTNEILSLISPFMGVLNYGNLRIPKKWDFPKMTDDPEDRISWLVQYEFLLRSGKERALVYVPNKNLWGIECSPYVKNIKVPLDRLTAISSFISMIKGIPEERTKGLKNLRSSGKLISEVIMQVKSSSNPKSLDLILSPNELSANFSPDEIAKLRTKCYEEKKNDFI